VDAIDRQIVEALVADARISLKNLSTRVKLSSPSVSERLRRLEERGVIRAFTVDLDPRALPSAPAAAGRAGRAPQTAPHASPVRFLPRNLQCHREF